MNKYEKNLNIGKEYSNKIIRDNDKNTDTLKKQFKYVWKNKFL